MDDHITWKASINARTKHSFQFIFQNVFFYLAGIMIYTIKLTYALFTLSGFDDQERYLTFVKTVLQVSKLKFHACNMKQAFCPSHKLNIARAWQ